VQAAEIDGAVGDGILIEPVALLDGGPTLPPSFTALGGMWTDTMTLVSQNTITYCGITQTYIDMDISGDYTVAILQEGANVRLCYTPFLNECLQGTVSGNRLVASRTWAQAVPNCGLTLTQEIAMELTIESDQVMRGTRTWTLTYSDGSQPPIQQVVTVSHVMNRQ